MAGRPNAALLFCLVFVVLCFHSFLARFIAVVSILSICLVYNSSIVVNCPSISAVCVVLYSFWFCCF